MDLWELKLNKKFLVEKRIKELRQAVFRNIDDYGQTDKQTLEGYTPDDLIKLTLEFLKMIEAYDAHERVS